MNIDDLKKQHQEINILIKEIEATLAPQAVTEKSYKLAMVVASLAAKLSVHLESEDKYFYPLINNHPSKNTQILGKKFAKEMGDITSKFTQYKTKYTIASNIKANPQQFIDDSKIILGIIKKRLGNEEKELYPMME